MMFIPPWTQQFFLPICWFQAFLPVVFLQQCLTFVCTVIFASGGCFLWGSAQHGKHHQSPRRPYPPNRSLNLHSSHLPLNTRHAVKPKMRMLSQLVKRYSVRVIVLGLLQLQAPSRPLKKCTFSRLNWW